MESQKSLIGKRLGDYRIISTISSGSYGTVFQGKHFVFEDDPPVAIKVLHAHLGTFEMGKINVFRWFDG